MDRTKAIELLRNAVPAKALPDDEIGFFIEAVSMAIKSLEQAHFVSGNTLVVTLPEEDLKATNRVLLDCKPWAKIFYADGGKDTNVPIKWIPVSERLPEEEGHYLVTDDSGGEKWVDSSVFLRSDDGSVYWDFVNVTAWMPLPEPYRKEP